MKFYFLFIFMLVTSLSFAQQRMLDSLDNLLQNASSDTARINLVNQKTRLISQVNLDSAIAMAAANLQHAIRIHYLKGEADCRVRSATNLCYKGSYPEAEKHLELAKKIYAASNDSSGLRSMYATYGILYGMQSQYEKSIDYFQQAAELAEKMNDLKNATSIYQNIATSYQMKSDYVNALANYQKALSLSEKLGDSATQSYAYLNLGMTYYAIKDTTRAKTSYLKAIAIARTLRIKNVELYAHSNIVNVYTAEKDYKAAYEAAMTANRLAIDMGDIGMEATTLSKAANQLALLNRFEEAEVKMYEAIKIADRSKQPINIYQANNVAGIVLKMKNKYGAAIDYFEKALAVMDSSDIYDEQIGESYFNLSDCYERTGNFTRALATYKKSAAIADSIRSKENVRKATEMYMNYDFEKKQQLAKAEQQQRDAINRTKQRALLAGLILAFFTALLAFYAFYHKRKANATLQEQKIKIENTLVELKSAQDQLVQSEKMASLGELTAGIAHEIQNPLNFVNNFSDINRELLLELKEEIKKGNYNEVQAIADTLEENELKVNHHGKRADSIVKGMLQHSRSSTGAKEDVDINVLCDEYLRLAYHGLRARDKSFNATFKTNFDPAMGKLSVVPQDIGRLILNLLNNAFYAVQEKQRSGIENYEPTVTIGTKKLNDKIEIKISDNGNGIPRRVLDKIFQPFFTTKPTGQGTGLGLSLAYDIVKAHGGELTVDTMEGEGTHFKITLPA